MFLLSIFYNYTDGSDFVGREFTLTLSEEPNAVSCVGVQVTDDSTFEDVENFAVQLQTPGNEAAIRPGSATQATILIDDAGTSKSSYYVISHIQCLAADRKTDPSVFFYSLSVLCMYSD